MNWTSSDSVSPTTWTEGTNWTNSDTVSPAARTEDSSFYTTYISEQLLSTTIYNISVSMGDLSRSFTTPKSASFPLTAEYLNAKEVPVYTPALVYTVLLLLVGVPGNAIVLYVYFQKWGRSSTRTFILGLAMLDLVNCLVTYPMEIALMLRPFLFDYSVLCKVTRFATYCCNTSSGLVLIAIAVDRYQRICRPLHNPMTPRTAKIIIFCAIGIAILFLWPSLVLYGTQSIPVTKTAILKLCLIQDNFVATKYPLIFFVFNGVFTVIIFLILSILYSLVGIKVCKHRTFRSKSQSVTSLSDYADEDDQFYLGNQEGSQKSRKELLPLKGKRSQENGSGEDAPPAPGAIKLVFKTTSDTLRKARKSVSDKRLRRVGKTTIMLFLVTLLYVICFTPFLGIAFHRTIHKESFKNQTKSEKMAFYVILRSYLLNCAINPLIYSFCNDLFRKECAYIFKKLFRKNSR
ncbi:orexin receptor type 2-like [Ostrea edulis]|uniref:orexin receptor type 2-like n=1 Tax=Ostrea edulis TaxID=37623 RepID=UPI0024AFC447|nr:orexin receptor type 2-like [Ostrea edulis]XP_056022372.1 orexin receptor type 2-like [Ostrea edulis]XP_056022373.1 orexin receptor type 2-like [Ostrea edulis]XP_056022374.1 orexin receptor type 2-like [Ostrea edulis]XP_056022375.1 orexin receptor type 2-like [Ostrea edulis]XP_056022376.1 orexin receptor type 2-like [Ostrea edulis]XP_056022377.1 orexin receptor type 2-like [Ostrea edulis]XP_056022378.1 orexin receptor type 2-like [Ostrea edulis]